MGSHLPSPIVSLTGVLFDLVRKLETTLLWMGYIKTPIKPWKEFSTPYDLMFALIEHFPWKKFIDNKWERRALKSLYHWRFSHSMADKLRTRCHPTPSHDVKYLFESYIIIVKTRVEYQNPYKIYEHITLYRTHITNSVLLPSLRNH